MTMIRNIVLSMLAVFLLSCNKDSNNNTVNPLLSAENVQALINKAENGDTVMLPSGEATWTSIVRIPDDKKIVLTGSGSLGTVISSEIPPDIYTYTLDLGKSGSRVTNIVLKLKYNKVYGIKVSGSGWRIDHCQFDFNGIIDENNRYNVQGVWAIGEGNQCPVGVIDHCTFNAVRILVYGQGKMMANETWIEPLGLGTNNAVFVEDCLFNSMGLKDRQIIDANYGGRYVFRHNILNNCYLEAHSVQGINRATRSWEIYENEFNHTVSKILLWPIYLRGGTGVVFNNTFNGEWYYPNIVVDNYRSFKEFEGSGLANGTSPWDGNEETNGYPARDQIGRSTDQWLWTDGNPYPPQILEPMYQWNNKYNGENMEVHVFNNCEHHIRINRDYYDNQAKPDYIPFVYPHPFTSE